MSFFREFFRGATRAEYALTASGLAVVAIMAIHGDLGRRMLASQPKASCCDSRQLVVAPRLPG
jgi:hypothetical protein